MADANKRPGSSAGDDFISRLQTQAPEAWVEFVEIYHRLIYYWCRCANLNKTDAEDVQHDICLTVYRGLPTFCGEGSLLGWVRKIAHNEIVHWKRKKARQPADMSRLDGQAEHSDGVPTSSDRMILEITLVQMVRSRFDASKQRTVFEEIMLRQRPIKDVAYEFGIPEHELHTIRSRIRKYIRERLVGDGR